MGRKFYIFTIGIFLVNQSFGQVGIGNTDPNSTLDITSSNQTAPSNTDGILIPRIDEFPLTNPGGNQDGMLVYATGIGTPQKGFYYWDNGLTAWVSISDNTGWKTTGNSGTNPSTNFVGTTDNQNLSFRVNNQEKIRVTDKSQIEIFNSGSSIFLGQGAGQSDDSTPNKNVFVGHFSGNNTSSGEENVAIGGESLIANTFGSRNTAVGYKALNKNINNFNNTIIGHTAAFNTSADNNTVVGYRAFFSNTTGHSNVAIGLDAMYQNQTGGQNIGIGYRALYENRGAGNNVGIGYQALYSTLGGGSNVAVGNGAGGFINGSGNVAVGTNAGLGATGMTQDWNVFIGYQAGRDETGSNRLYIENSNANEENALIYGEFDNEVLRINGEIQVGVPSSTGYSLPMTDGTINQTLKTDGNGNIDWTSSVYQSYLDTGATTGNYVITSQDYTVRVADNVSGVTIPDAALNTNRIIVIIGSNGITSKAFTFSGGGIFDDVTNTNIISINANERFTIQSDGAQWIVIGN